MEVNQITPPALDVAASAAVYRRMGSEIIVDPPATPLQVTTSPNRPQEDEMEASSSRRSAAGSRVASLAQYGQSAWLDFIRRSLIAGGELQRLVVEDGLGGGGAAFSRGEPGPPRRPVPDVVIAIGARARTSTRRAGAAVA